MRCVYVETEFSSVNRYTGFYPVAADTSEERLNVPQEGSCPNVENTALNSNAKPSHYDPLRARSWSVMS